MIFNDFNQLLGIRRQATGYYHGSAGVRGHAEEDPVAQSVIKHAPTFTRMKMVELKPASLAIIFPTTSCTEPRQPVG